LRNENGDQLAQIRSYKVDLSIKNNNLVKLTKKYQKALDLAEDLSTVNSLISAELEIKG
jgi:hypothetical protein